MAFAAIFAMVVGAAMAGQWSLTILRGEVPSLEDDAVAGRGRVEMVFHWAAEFLTAFGLLAGGLGLLAGWGWAHPLYLIAMGMLLYSLVNSPGYFAQLGQWRVVGVFALMLVLALVSVGLVL
jgi:hypothetical protein